jgi:glycerate 2-kinase
MPQALAAPDKFRGTLTARQAAAAIAAGAARAGWATLELPLADGGEGTLDVLGGGNRKATVSGVLGEPIEAAWRLDDDGTALIEAARACGLSLAGGPQRNDPLRATSRGVGELVAAAVAAGAGRIVVAVGGVASTDGGLGAVETLRPLLPLPVPLEVACDVEAPFLAAAEVFAPQKGATPEQVARLRERLDRLAKGYRHEFGVDVRRLPGSGAAGGLAGGLAAVGGRLLSGFDLVADRLGLDERLAEADLVVTGEGLLDATSFTGKVVGRVLARAAAAGVETLVVAGDVVIGGLGDAISLVDRCGPDRALAEPAECITELVATALAIRRKGP